MEEQTNNESTVINVFINVDERTADGIFSLFDGISRIIASPEIKEAISDITKKATEKTEKETDENEPI